VTDSQPNVPTSSLIDALERAGLIIQITDDQSVIEYVSAGFSNLTGYQPSEVIGKKVSIISSGRQRVEFYQHLWARLVEGKAWQGTFVNRKKDGTHYSDPQTIAPLVDQDGKTRHFISIRDSRLAKTLENTGNDPSLDSIEHLDLAKRFDFLLTNIDAIFYTHDREGQMTYLSPSVTEITGYTQQEWSTHYSTFLTDSELNSKVGQYTERILDSGEQLPPYNVELYHKDGTVLTFEIHEAPMYSGDEVVGVLGFARNVTDELWAKLRLQQAERLESLGRLAAGVAHEINTPMQYIYDNVGYLQKAIETLNRHIESWESRFKESEGSGTLGDGTADRAVRVSEIYSESLRALEDTFKGIEQVKDITQSMRYASFIDSENFQKVDVVPLIESALILTKNQWKNYAVLEVDLPDTLSEVVCTPGLLVQVFTNLINNSVEAIRERFVESEGSMDGRITVRAKKTGDEIEITLGDNGAGISEEIHQRVFEPFFTTKAPGQGTGQGLPFVYSVVVEKHGGEVRFESAPGEGTSFTIILPFS